jgi:hypothetical protein
MVARRFDPRMARRGLVRGPNWDYIYAILDRKARENAEIEAAERKSLNFSALAQM